MSYSRFATEIAQLRFGGFVLGVVLATVGFGWAFGWAVGVGVFGFLIVLASLLEKH